MIKNAAEALALSQTSPVCDIVHEILARIEKVASDDSLEPAARRFIRVGDHGFCSPLRILDNDLPNSKCGRIMDRLRAVGFVVSINTDPIDPYLEIKW